MKKWPISSLREHKGGNEEEEDKQMEAEDRRFQMGWDSHEGRGEPWDHRGEVGKKIKKEIERELANFLGLL